MDWAQETFWSYGGCQSLAVGKTLNGQRHLVSYINIDCKYDAVQWCTDHNMTMYKTLKSDSGTMYDIYRNEDWSMACAIPHGKE